MISIRKSFDRKGISTLTAAIIVVIIIVAIIVGILFYNNWMWQETHYDIKAGYVAIVTDQIGSVLRIEKGPRGWAEKATWETVTKWNIQVRTEEMISPSEVTTIDNYSVTIMRPEPLGNRRFGAVPFTTADGGRVSIDISVTYHFDVEKDGWQYRIKSLYSYFPGVNPETLSGIENTTLQMIRGALRSYASDVGYATDELAYTMQGETERDALPYVQAYLNGIITLNHNIVIDMIAFRSRIPDANLQVAHQKRLIAIQEAETMLITANATRQATVTVAEGQSIAINLVTNATSTSIERLIAQNVTAEEAIQYLGLQYEYDALRKIAEAHPDWKLTIFINAPTLTYTIPVNP